MIEHSLVFHSKPIIKRRSRLIKSESFEGSIEELFQRYLYYRAMYELVRDIAAEHDIDAMLVKMLDKLNTVLRAERSLVLIFDEHGDIAYQKGRNLHRDDIERPTFEVSWNIIKKVRRRKQSICLPNALESKDFSSKSIIRLKILSVLCTPIQDNGNNIGILYLDNRHLKGVFCEKQQIILQHISSTIAPHIYNRLQTIELQLHLQAIQDRQSGDSFFPDIIGHDPKLRKVLMLARQVANSTATVLIEGASGTGKELVARAIHRLSSRCAKKFISLNCGALTETLLESELFGHVKGAFTGAFTDKKGWFETADGGTIFFDEISEMSRALQVKLLRVLQSGEFSPVGSDVIKNCNVRILAATNRHLADLVQSKQFRDDLYYRLNIITLELPLLKNRPKDILLLAVHFLRKYDNNRGEKVELSPQVQRIMQSYHYPGNIRELENAIQRALLLCNGRQIKPEHLPPEMQQSIPFATKPLGSFAEEKQVLIADFEKNYIMKALQAAHGVVTRAARMAQMDGKNFYQKMNKYGINALQFKKQER